jgi:hypothetical protein
VSARTPTTLPSTATSEWQSVTYPPPAQQTVWLRTEAGEEVLGWAVYDSLLGRRFYWQWTDNARLPSKYVSRLQRAGLAPVRAVAWRPYSPARITIPSEPFARREAEVLVHRVILTDGTMRGLRKGGLESSWDAALHHDEKERGAGEMIDFEHVNKVRFMPTPKDVQNYEDGVVMRWFLALRAEGKRGAQDGLSDLQKTFVFRAYGFSHHVIGDKIDVTERQAKYLYRKAVDLVWDRALDEDRPVRRLRKEEWDRPAAHGR